MNNRGRNEDDRVEELSFEDDRPPPRAGDPRVEDDGFDPEISAERARTAGTTSGETDLTDVTDEPATDDDASPATLLEADELTGDAVAADESLSIVDAGAIGGGFGLDEEELAKITGRPD